LLKLLINNASVRNENNGNKGNTTATNAGPQQVRREHDATPATTTHQPSRDPRSSLPADIPSKFSAKDPPPRGLGPGNIPNGVPSRKRTRIDLQPSNEEENPDLVGDRSSLEVTFKRFADSLIAGVAPDPSPKEGTGGDAQGSDGKQFLPASTSRDGDAISLHEAQEVMLQLARRGQERVQELAVEQGMQTAMAD
jgi:hypothetical protein